MGMNTAIAWCDHTFNPWRGCAKVSPACTRCYAEEIDGRFSTESHWGVDAPRLFFADRHWNEPLRWNRAAAAAGVRASVFCASTADVFEDRPDLVEPRLRLWRLIGVTPWLDWLLLTKRPQNIRKMLPHPVMIDDGHDTDWYAPAFPNVWLGATVENQEWAEERLPYLLENLATVHFVSCEPLLGPLDLAPWLPGGAAPSACPIEPFETRWPVPRVRWVITGCESGKGARPQNVDDFRELRDQCARARVPFFFKQATPVPGLIQLGKHSWTKPGGIIEQPWLDGEQHTARPTFRQCELGGVSVETDIEWGPLA